MIEKNHDAAIFFLSKSARLYFFPLKSCFDVLLCDRRFLFDVFDRIIYRAAAAAITGAAVGAENAYQKGSHV